MSEHKEMSLSAVVEEIESENDVKTKQSLRQISIVSASEDEKTSAEHDDEMDKLMERIKKQRNALDDIIDQESKNVVEENKNETVEEESERQEIIPEAPEKSKPQPEGSPINSFCKITDALKPE